MKYAFYPGCSLESSSTAYDVSVRAVASRVGLTLHDIDDWNCCGATEYWSQDKLTACAVIARNLALVPKDCDQVTAPCAACYLNLRKVDHLMAEHPDLGAKVNEALAAGGLKYKAGQVRVRHLLEVLYDDVGEDKLKAAMAKPLTGLRVAAYYGCQVVRPHDGVDDPEYPMKLDRMLTWLGAEVVDYPVKSHCCSGHMTQISDAQSLELIRRLLQSAQDYKADVIACLCPMCQLNMDAYQSKVNNYFNTKFNIPVLFFTQLIGVALGISVKDLGFGKEIVAAEGVLTERIKDGNGKPVAAAAAT